MVHNTPRVGWPYSATDISDNWRNDEQTGGKVTIELTERKCNTK